ncbi:MAG: DUF4115 domain-containing protein [Acidobacteria bacterium]|nr:DUF4115 domain-containing protein [Acidobacteriota bacterium]
MAIDLKQEREKKKISLAQIASDTRISLRYLESIESGRYNDLPGGVYNRAFIKAYCESINIDPHEILEHYSAQASSSVPEKSPKTASPIPHQGSFFIPVPILIWSIMLLISAAGLFFSREWIAELFAPYFAEETVAKGRYASNPREPGSGAQLETATGALSAAMEPNVDTGDSREAAVAPPDHSPLSEEKPVPAEIPAKTKLVMEILAQDSCWISVDVDGRPSSRRLMEPGEELVFNAAERLFLLLGNAGGVHLKINGKPAKPLGKPGEVIKMNIDLENLQQFLDESTG